MADRLKGKVAIVTGAGRGIGRAEALLLAAEGAAVVVNDLGGSMAGEGASSEPADQVVGEIRANDGQAVANYDNVAEMQGGENLVKTALDTYGRLDILVNNAGILRDQMIFDMSEAEWDTVIAVHLKGHFTTTRAASVVFRQHLGINAIDDAARIVAALERLPCAEEPGFGRGSVCTLNIAGGYGRQYAVVVPSRCEVIINRLLVPHETPVEALEQLRALIATLDLRSEVVVELIPPAFEAYALDTAAPILADFQQAYRAVTGREPYFAPHLGITDANVFVGEGHIPTVVFGPRGGAHHTAAEYADVSSFEPVARVHAETARRYLGT